MAIDSSTGEFMLGMAASEGVFATKYNRFIATVSGVGINWRTRENAVEHPAASGVPWDKRSADKRSGYTVPLRVEAFIRPKMFPMLLRANGWKITTAAGGQVGSYVHTCIPGTELEQSWMGCRHILGEGGDLFTREVRAIKGNNLNVSIAPAQATVQSDMIGKAEREASGTPTFTAEADYLLSSEAGTLTCTIGGVALFADPVGGIDWVWGQELDEEQRYVFAPSSIPLDRTQVSSEFTINDAGMYNAVWQKVARGGSAATAPLTTTHPIAALSYNILGDNIPTTTLPYSISWTVPAAQLTLPNDGIRASTGKIRQSVTAKVLGSSSPAITIVVTNDQPTYVS